MIMFILLEAIIQIIVFILICMWGFKMIYLLKGIGKVLVSIDKKL